MGGGVIKNPVLNYGDISGTTFFGNLFSALISLGFVVGSLVFFFILLTGGVQWMTSGGDKNAYESAKSKLTHAFIGLVILFSFFAIIYFVECFFGIGLRSIRIGPFNIGFANAPFCSQQRPGPIRCSGEGQKCATNNDCCENLRCAGNICSGPI